MRGAIAVTVEAVAERIYRNLTAKRAASKADKLNRRTLGNDASQAPDLADFKQQKPE